jgi:hypothetical protein
MRGAQGERHKTVRAELSRSANAGREALPSFDRLARARLRANGVKPFVLSSVEARTTDERRFPPSTDSRARGSGQALRPTRAREAQGERHKTVRAELSRSANAGRKALPSFDRLARARLRTGPSTVSRCDAQDRPFDRLGSRESQGERHKTVRAELSRSANAGREALPSFDRLARARLRANDVKPFVLSSVEARTTDERRFPPSTDSRARGSGQALRPTRSREAQDRPLRPCHGVTLRTGPSTVSRCDAQGRPFDRLARARLRAGLSRLFALCAAREPTGRPRSRPLHRPPRRTRWRSCR